MLIFISWILFSALAGRIASNKGRSGTNAFMLSIMLSPLIGLLIASCQQKNQKILDARLVKSGHYKHCQNCQEIIRKKAETCRYCKLQADKKPLQLEAV